RRAMFCQGNLVAFIEHGRAGYDANGSPDGWKHPKRAYLSAARFLSGRRDRRRKQARGRAPHITCFVHTRAVCSDRYRWYETYLAGSWAGAGLFRSCRSKRRRHDRDPTNGALCLSLLKGMIMSEPTVVARKKLIEVALPLEAINAASAREKAIRHGHPSTLHLWWARRPLAAARAVIFAQMV